MSFSFLKKSNRREDGFGIMEIIVSIAIISFAFVGMMSLFAFNLRVEQMNRNKVIGAYLAQEAIEVVRQKRDNNWFTSQNWENGIGTGNHLVISANNYSDPTQGWSLQQGSSEAAAEKYKQKVYFVDNRYVQTVAANGDTLGWKYTGFRRFVNITNETVGTASRKKVHIEVYYGDNVLLTVTTYLYNNWY